MNSKKNKKNNNGAASAVNNNIENTDTKIIQKKSKKDDTILNGNGNVKQKSKKRKHPEPEADTPTPKKSKKSIEKPEIYASFTDELESSVTEEIGEHSSQAETTNVTVNNEGYKRKSTGEELRQIFDDVPSNSPLPKKMKKKSKVPPVDIQEEDPVLRQDQEEISPKKKKHKNKLSMADIAQESVDNLESSLNNNRTIMKHEVNIIDIKDQNENDGNENVVTISIQDVGGEGADWDEDELLKQLEKKIEKKEESPKIRKTTIPTWPEEDLKELVNRMEVCIPENDDKSFLKRIEELEWDTIAFKNYSVEDCKQTWSFIQKKIRRFRLLKEVLQDAKEWVSRPKSKKKNAKLNRHPDMPRRPLSLYFIYYLKKKEALQAEHPGMDASELAKMCSLEFKKLPPEKKEKYEKIAQKNKEEYEQRMKEFYELHPEEKPDKPPKPPKSPKPLKEKSPKEKTHKEKIHKEKVPPKPKAPKRSLPPFQYYFLSETEKENVEDKVAFKEVCKERWKNMPDDKKMEWISYAEAENFKYEEEMKEYLKNHPEHVVQGSHKSLLTKEELQVKERVSGKPAKPPVSAYNLFARTLLQTEEIKTVPVRDRLVYVSTQWKQCSEDEKKHYKDLFEKISEKYKLDYASYLESLPEEERQLELKKNAPKKLKSEQEKPKKEPKQKEKKKATPTKATKKVAAEKKAEKKTKKLIEPEQPPISPFKYFVTQYKGEEPAKAWKALTPEQKKVYENELIKKKQEYIVQFEKFLKSMTKEELEAFSNARNKVKQQQDEEEESSDESDSEDSDEESADDEADD